MNTYIKYCPNVFVAKCTEQHEKGETIIVTTQYGKEHECIVFNLVGRTKDESYCYSIVRADGFNVQEQAKLKAERLQRASMNAEKKSNQYWEASHEGADFLALGEPIKVGHHSEKRHRALYDRNNRRIEKAIEFEKISESYESRVGYWEAKASDINLSMPECLDYYEFELEKAKAKHEGMKNGTIERLHGMSLQYANKEVKELEKKIQIAKKLWE